MGPLPGFPGGACVLPRSAVFFTRIDLRNVPQRQRPEALKLELEQKAPFEETGGWVLWQGALACVWYWPRDLQQRAGDECGGLDLVPETALWPELEPEGYRWIDDTDSGLVLVQYKHTQQGLYEKRFPAPVSREEVSAWLSRHGARGIQVDDLAPMSLPSLANPVGRGLESRESSLESRVFPLACLLLGFVVLAYGVAIVRASLEADAAREQARSAEQGVGSVVDSRQQAARLQSGNAVLSEYRGPSQVNTAARLAEVLDIQGGRLVRWTYRDGRLELSWEPQGDLPDSTRVITLLEETPGFSDVEAQTRGDSLVEITMQVVSVPASRGAANDD